MRASYQGFDGDVVHQAAAPVSEYRVSDLEQSAGAPRVGALGHGVGPDRQPDAVPHTPHGLVGVHARAVEGLLGRRRLGDRHMRRQEEYGCHLRVPSSDPGAGALEPGQGQTGGPVDGLLQCRHIELEGPVASQHR